MAAFFRPLAFFGAALTFLAGFLVVVFLTIAGGRPRGRFSSASDLGLRPRFLALAGGTDDDETEDGGEGGGFLVTVANAAVFLAGRFLVGFSDTSDLVLARRLRAARLLLVSRGIGEVDVEGTADLP